MRTVPDTRERPTWAEWLQAAGVTAVRADAGLHFSDSGLAIAAALDGLGVALVSKPLVATEVAAGRLVVPFGISLRRRFAYYIVTPQAVAPRANVAAFRDWLLDEARRDAIAQKLMAGVAAIQSSADFARWLTWASGFYQYSANNMLLIWTQRPDAELVAGQNGQQRDGPAEQHGEQVEADGAEHHGL